MPAAAAGVNRQRGRFIFLTAGLALVAAYALSQFFPPATQPAATGANLDLIGRLFPGVPAAWMLMRLACLAVGAACIALATRPADFPRLPPRATESVPLRRAYMIVALAMVATQVTLAAVAGDLPRSLQLTYVALFVLPAATLALGERRKSGAVPHVQREAIVFAAIALLWFAIQVGVGWESPRRASMVDTWDWNPIWAAAQPRFNLINGQVHPGVTALHAVLHGAGILGASGELVPFGWIQTVQAAWLIVAAWALWRTGTLLIGPGTGLVAASALLFSPFGSLAFFGRQPIFFGPLTIGVAMLLALDVHMHRRASSLALLAAVVGVAVTQPITAPYCLAIAALTALSLVRRPWMPLPTLVIPALTLLAAGAALPPLTDLGGMMRRFATSAGSWTALEAVIFGQAIPSAVQAAWEGPVRPLDRMIWAALMPFATPRTPIRLLGDSAYDPVGAALAAVGIAVCLRSWRHNRTALLALASAILAGLISSYDRPSIARMLAMPVMVALLAGVGFEALRRELRRSIDPLLACLPVCAAIALGGIVLFNVTNLTILASSTQELTIRALGNDGATPAAVYLDPMLSVAPEAPTARLPWLQTDAVFADFPRPSVQVIPFAGPSVLKRGDMAVAPLLFWSPALETMEKISADVCGIWPDASIYVIVDRAGLSRVYAANPGLDTWTPHLPPSQWTRSRCRQPTAGGYERSIPSSRKNAAIAPASSSAGLHGAHSLAASRSNGPCIVS